MKAKIEKTDEVYLIRFYSDNKLVDTFVVDQIELNFTNKQNNITENSTSTPKEDMGFPSNTLR